MVKINLLILSLAITSLITTSNISNTKSPTDGVVTSTNSELVHKAEESPQPDKNKAPIIDRGALKYKKALRGITDTGVPVSHGITSADKDLYEASFAAKGVKNERGILQQEEGFWYDTAGNKLESLSDSEYIIRNEDGIRVVDNYGPEHYNKDHLEEGTIKGFEAFEDDPIIVNTIDGKSFTLTEGVLNHFDGNIYDIGGNIRYDLYIKHAK